MGRYFESYVLSTKVTPQLVSRQVVESRLEFGGKCSRVRVIRVVAYVQPLNASSEPKDWCIALDAMIGISEGTLAGSEDELVSKQPFFRWLWSFDLEEKIVWYLVHEVSILTKLTATSSKPSSE